MSITIEILQEAVLDFAQRRKRAQTLRKFASKIQMARKRAMAKLATTDLIDHRAHRAAIKIVRKIVAGKLGVEYDTLSVGQKMEVDKKVQMRSKLVARIAGRLIPKIRQKETERYRAMHPVSEAAGAGEDGTPELVNRYVKDTPYQGNPFLPGLVLNTDYYNQKYGQNAETVMKLVTMKTSERARKTDDS